MSLNMRTKTAFITHCALFAALTAVFSQISFPAGPFPFSMGLFAVMICGGMLKPLPAFVTQAVYLIIGAVGLPVFSGFRGGIQCLLGPTGGFLIAYPFAAMIVSLCFSAGKKRLPLSMLGYASALALCYVSGAAWYSLVSEVNFLSAVTVTVLPFLIPDALKAVCAHIISSLVTARLRIR